MVSNTTDNNWRKLVRLVTVLMFGVVGIYLFSSGVFSSGLYLLEVKPLEGERGFIALPSADTIQVQNVYSTSAQIDLRFVGAGSPGPIADALPAGRGRVYAKPAGFSGFASINADQQVQAVNFDLGESGSQAYLGVQLDGVTALSNSAIGSGFADRASGQPSGISAIQAHAAGCQPGTATFDIPIPVLMKENAGWTSRFSIQNPSNSFANVFVQICNLAGDVVYTDFGAISSGGTFSIDLASTSVPAGFFGSAMITADQPIQVASSVELYNNTARLRSAYRIERTEGTQLVVPALFKNADRQTSQLCVQNGGTSDRSFTIAYTDNVSANRTIPAGRTSCFQQKDEAHADGWVGGALITSDTRGLYFAVVLVDAIDQNTLVGRWAYSAPEKGKVDAQGGLAFPLLYNDHQAFDTSIHVTNFGAQTATVTPSFTAQSGFSPCVQSFTLAPGQTRTLTQADLPAQFDVGSAYFSATQPVAAVAGATSTKPLGKTDRHFGYGAAYLTAPGTHASSCGPGGFAGYRPADEQFWSYQRGYYMEMGVPEMWATGLTGIKPSNPITIAVIDTGADLDHPDLAANLVAGFDFVEEDTQPQDTSADSHGTKVAGVIAARMNNDPGQGKARGAVGIGGGNSLFSGTGLRIMPLRISAETSSTDLCAASTRAIDYAVNHGARIINISYGSPDQCPDELAAIQRAYTAGVVVVAGAGNNNSADPFYPAAYGAGSNENLVIAVAGLDPGGNKAYASNYGPWVDLAAPYHVRSLTKDGDYASDGGTSFSAPFVSGLLGILMSHFDLSGTEAVQVLRTTAVNVDAANSAQFQGQLGAGRISAMRAVQANLFQLYTPLIVLGDPTSPR